MTHEEYCKYWQRLGDYGRSDRRAKATLRLIRFWEQIKRFRKWTSIASIVEPQASEGRWVRRTLITLSKAGLVERQIRKDKKPGIVTMFRVRKEGL